MFRCSIFLYKPKTFIKIHIDINKYFYYFLYTALNHGFFIMNALGNLAAFFCSINTAHAMDEDNSSFNTRSDAPSRLRSRRDPFRDRARAFQWEMEQERERRELEREQRALERLVVIEGTYAEFNEIAILYIASFIHLPPAA